MTDTLTLDRARLEADAATRGGRPTTVYLKKSGDRWGQRDYLFLCPDCDAKDFHESAVTRGDIVLVYRGKL